MKQLMIKCNVGHNDKAARMLLGTAAMVGALFMKDRKSKMALGGLGLAAIATGASRYDPIYHLLGFRHCQAAYRAFPHLLRRL